MNRTNQPYRSVIVGLAMSLGVHLGVMSLFAWAGPPGGPEPMVATPDTAHHPPRVTLGIEESRHITVTWLGMAEATPHEAPQSEVEQMALTLAPPARAQAVPSVPEMPPIEIEAPAEPDKTPIPPTLAPPPNPGRLIRTAADPLARMIARVPAIIARLEAMRLEQAVPPRPATPGDSSAEVAARDTTAEEPDPDTADVPDRPGRSSDRESPATARTRTVLVRPGQVIAGQGLRVKTRVGVFSIPTRLLGSRRRPIFRLSFDRLGVVRQVELVRSSGNPNIDEPWISALYGWTAAGTDLDALPEDDPKARVTILVELLPPKPY